MVARPVYAPALVAFVGGPRLGMSLEIGTASGVAWFPLGPHEVYRPAYRVSEVYVRQLNISHVNVANINLTNVRYVNQNAGSVTVVSRDAFVGARPVRAAQVTVPAEVIAQGRVFGSTANVAPERISVMGAPRGTVAAPPSRFEGRTVVVRHAPPPPPVSFAARRDALQANPGRPLDPGAAEALRRNQSPRAPQFRQAQPAAPAARDAMPPRNDRPRAPQEPQATPRTEPRSDAAQQPRSERKQEKKKGEAKKEDKKEERKQ
jgi:hypothetical protein